MSLNTHDAFFFFFFLQQLTLTLLSYSGTKPKEQWFHFLCKRMLSKCSYNGQLDWAFNVYSLKRESKPMKNTYPWKHLCLFPGLYDVFITTSWQHCSKVCYLFWTRYSSVPLGLQESAWGQTKAQEIPLRGNKRLTWFITDLQTTRKCFTWSEKTVGFHLEVRRLPGWMQQSDCQCWIFDYTSCRCKYT